MQRCTNLVALSATMRRTEGGKTWLETSAREDGRMNGVQSPFQIVAALTVATSLLFLFLDSEMLEKGLLKCLLQTLSDHFSQHSNQSGGNESAQRQEYFRFVRCGETRTCRQHDNRRQTRQKAYRRLDNVFRHYAKSKLACMSKFREQRRRKAICVD